MSETSVKLNWEGEAKFTASTPNGHSIQIDGDKETGPSPMEILLEAVGACSAIDVVIIMEKVRTPLTRFEISMEGTRHSPEPRYFTDIKFRFDAWGKGINPDKLERAINLSIIKYCSVFHSLRPDTYFTVEYRIHAPGVDPRGDYRPVGLGETSKN